MWPHILLYFSINSNPPLKTITYNYIKNIAYLNRYILSLTGLRNHKYAITSYPKTFTSLTPTQNWA